MAAIEEDVMRAGLGLPPLVQVFTQGLDGAGGQGTISLGQATDQLEMVVGDPGCGVAPLCVGQSPGAAGLFEMHGVPACMQASLPGLLALFTGPGLYVIQPATLAVDPPPSGCGAAQLNLTAARAAGTPSTPAAGPIASARGVAPVQFVRYEIAPCGPTDLAGDGVTLMPCLWRSTTGRFDLAGNNVGPAPGAPAGNGVWQIVARGIDDLQVRYRNGANIDPAALPFDDPGAVCLPPNNGCNNAAGWATLVRRVEVTLSARVVARDLAGEMSVGAGVPAAVRGQLTGVFTPRAVLATLSTLPSPNPLWQ
jgi:hypothetical protein